MFKSEVTNGIIFIVLLFLSMAVVLSNYLITTSFRVFVILVYSALILKSIYRIIKIKKQKAD